MDFFWYHYNIITGRFRESGSKVQAQGPAIPECPQNLLENNI